MTIVVALSFGKSSDPRASTNPSYDLPFNSFLTQKYKEYLNGGYVGFTDLGNPKPTLLTIDKAVEYSEKSGDIDFVLLVADNGHFTRAKIDLLNSIEKTSLQFVGEITFDKEVKTYPGYLLYRDDSLQPWTRTWYSWTWYNFKATVMSFLFPEKYRVLSYKYLELNKRPGISDYL